MAVGGKWLRAKTAVGFALLALSAPLAPLLAQAPNLDWRTITTQHFHVHFTPPVEGLARRVAGSAERAYAELSQQLHPPRGMIDVVISDDVDASNGSATPFPTNRIVVYASPPVSESALRFTNDWGQTVITHELTHIFHLDRVRGLWWLGQHVFGRAAALFPNFYSPSWITEGLAVYEESKLAGAGRVEGSEHRMIARAAAVEHRFPSLGALSLAYGRFPFGEQAYGYGSLFMDYLARTRGDTAVRRFVEKSSADIIPYFIDVPAKQGFGISFTRAWREFRDSVTRSLPATTGEIAPSWRSLTTDGVYALAPRWQTDSALIYSGTPGRESFGAYRVDLSGRRTRIGRRNGRSPNVMLADGSLLYSQSDFVNPYQLRSDLWIQRGSHEQQITFGQRLINPDVRADGEIVAVQITPGATRLARVTRDGKSVRPITVGTYDELWTEPRWSHRGDRIAAVRWLHGNLSQIVVIDSSGRQLSIVASSASVQATPSWAPDDSGLFYSSDVTGTAQLYFSHVGGSTYRVSHAITGLFEPEPSPAGDHLASVLFSSDGYHLGVLSCCNIDPRWTLTNNSPALTSSSADTVIVATATATRYSPWRTLVPHYWLPTIDQGISGGYRFGATTTGVDVIGRHSLSAGIQFPTNNTGITARAAYQYSGFGLPIIQLDASQNWEDLGAAFSRDAKRTVVGELYRRTWTGEALATWLNSRVRRSISATGGFGIEHRYHTISNDVPVVAIDSAGAYGSPTYPSFIGGVGFANYQRPPFSISPEDGVQANLTVRDRFNSGASGNGGSSYSTVAQLSAFKSLNLPGYAHHVLALRGSAGFADKRAAGYYAVGGVSGNTFEVIPGYVIGEGRKTFPVRGFNSGTLLGIRAYTGSAEYRIPLLLTAASPGALPFFLDRSSLTVFGDYGTAWCPNIAAGREVCNQNTASLTQRLDIASAGAELNLNLGILSWDAPYRFRVGLVHPIQNAAYFGRSNWSTYLVGGVSF